MHSYLVQEILNIVFTEYMVYIAPILFALMTLLFSDKLIDVIYNSVTSRRRWR